MNRYGFTLLELMAGLLVSAVVIATVARGYGMVAESVSSLEHRRVESTRRMNGRHWLAQALGSVEAGADSGRLFAGRPDELRCTTWLIGPGGWPERTSLLVRLADGALRATTDRGDVVFADSIAGVRFDYLLEPGLESPWVGGWESPVSVPFAIRIRMWHRRSAVDNRDRARDHATDTLLVLVGGRG